MNSRIVLIDKLRDLNGLLLILQKEIMSTNVPGLMLTREDLGIRYPKKERKNAAHGQVHSSNRMPNRITEPAGTEIHNDNDSGRVLPYYQEWRPEDLSSGL